METQQCQLCGSSEDNEIKFGRFISSQNTSCHQYCLLFAPGLLQNGSDEEELDGFLIKDINKEMKRIRCLKCTFCHKKGANLGCCVKSCPKAYHISCGLKNGINLEFTTKYESFCKADRKIRQKEIKKLDAKCGMCYSNLSKTFPCAILIPCCKNSWYHKDCLQKFALASASLFKCPLCADKAVCIDKLKSLGIFFPIRDAAWELENSYYDDLYQPVEFTCESEYCLDKRKHYDKAYKFKLCDYCGSSGVHYECLETAHNKRFTCRNCQSGFQQSNEEKQQQPVRKKPKSFAAFIFGESDVSDESDAS